MFILQLLEKNGRVSEPMIFETFGAIQGSVKITWSSSKFKGEIVPKGDYWELFEMSPLGLKSFIGVIKKAKFVEQGAFIHKEATHL